MKNGYHGRIIIFKRNFYWRIYSFLFCLANSFLSNVTTNNCLLFHKINGLSCFLATFLQTLIPASAPSIAESKSAADSARSCPIRNLAYSIVATANFATFSFDTVWIQERRMRNWLFCNNRVLKQWFSPYFSLVSEVHYFSLVFPRVVHNIWIKLRLMEFSYVYVNIQ